MIYRAHHKHPRGTPIIFWQCVQPKVWNPYPYLRIFLSQKTADLTVLGFFFFNFWKLGLVFKGFSASKIADFFFFNFSCNFFEMGFSSKDFLDPKWDPCLIIIVIITGSYNTQHIYPIGYSMCRCGATATLIRQPQTHPHNEEPEIQNRILWEGSDF